jgi:nucleotide-binding universal stress UspA family protein
MLQKVLVPLNGSELAQAILPYVEEICRRCDPVQVTLLQVVPQPGGGSRVVRRPPIDDYPRVRLLDARPDLAAAGPQIYREQALAAARVEVQVALAPAVRRLRDAGIPVHVDVAFGRPAEEIIAYASREGIDLIIMSTRGHVGLSRWIWGSVADKVLHGTHLPILMVRPLGLTGIPFPPQSEIEL